MRVLHVINDFNVDSGGAQRIIVELCRRLPQTDFTQTVAHFTGQGTLRDYIPESCSVIKVNGFHGGVIPDFLSMSSLLSVQNPDIVHVHSPSTGLVARGLARLSGKKVVTTVHAITVSPMGRIGDAITLRFSDAIVGVSNAATVAVKRRNRFFMDNCANYVTIVNGIDLPRFSVVKEGARDEGRQKLGLSRDDFVIGFVGRMHFHKGYDIALDIASQLRKHMPNFRMVMIGPASDQGEILAEIVRRGLGDNVQYPGSSSNIESIYPIFDLCVFPSRYEGFGLAPLEAMAMGCPVVASNIPAFKEVIGSSGVLVTPEGLSMAQAVNDLVGQPDKLLSLSKLGKERVKNYNVERMAQRYAALYDDLMMQDS